MVKALTEAGLVFTEQYVIGSYICDFAFIPEKVVVEVDGEYWHSLPKTQARDKKKEGYVVREGWTMLRFSESQVLGDIGECVKVILKTLDKYPRV